MLWPQPWYPPLLEFHGFCPPVDRLSRLRYCPVSSGLFAEGQQVDVRDPTMAKKAEAGRLVSHRAVS